jgi:hypothetical protein
MIDVHRREELVDRDYPLLQTHIEEKACCSPGQDVPEGAVAVSGEHEP